jgi:hypothetical protein
MSGWWESLSALQKVFTYIALPATVILIIQTILVLFGLGGHDADASGPDAGAAHDGYGGHDGHDGHDGSDGLALFSIRGIVAFFTVGGWAGVVVAGFVASPFITVVIALACGTAALYGIAVLFQITAKLQSAGNLSLDNAVGKTARVYITIPGGGKGFGKVTLTFQERFTECDAVTQTPHSIKTGTLVTVLGMADENTLIVEPVTENPEAINKDSVEEEKWKH